MADPEVVDMANKLAVECLAVQKETGVKSMTEKISHEEI